MVGRHPGRVGCKGEVACTETPGLRRLPVQGESLVQVQALAEVLLLGVEGFQLCDTGPVLLPLVPP